MKLKRSLLALVVTYGLMAPTNAYAHTALLSSNPKNKAVLHKAPTSITLNFNEPLIKISGKEISRVSLTDADGKSLALGALQITKGKIIAPITNRKLPSGRYKITYRVVSADGHPISGTLTFRVH